jgi:hypothetical protein
MQLEVHEVDQGAVYVHHDPHVPHVQGLSHEEFQWVMRHIKLISMNRRLYWMYLEVHGVDQGAVHAHHDPNVPNVQGQAHGEI